MVATISSVEINQYLRPELVMSKQLESTCLK